MIDQTVFDEMMDKEIITNVGLKSNDFESVDELMDRGLITNVAAGKAYANVETENGVDVLDEADLLEVITDDDSDVTLNDD